jgi:hypothetical protein
MKPDLQFFCNEWVRLGKKHGMIRTVEHTNCLFNEGELILIFSQSKKHPLNESKVLFSLLRVFHTMSQNKAEYDSNEDIARLKFLFQGLNEEFNIQYDEIISQGLLAAG